MNSPLRSACASAPQGGRAGQGTVPADCSLPASACGVLAAGAPGGPAKPDPRLLLEGSEPISERALSKLRWRCRRGMLENDLLIERFFRRHAYTLTQRQGVGLTALMELADNDLLDLLLARTEPQAEVDQPEVHEVLAMMRQPHAPLN